MKKFTTLALAMVMGASFTTMAQDLGQGTAIVQTNIGSMMMPQYVNNIAPEYLSALTTVYFVWGSNINQPTKISLVDPQQSSTMIPGQPNTYAPVKLLTPGATSEIQINASVNNEGTMLSVNLLSAQGAGLGEYTVTIPANTVKDADGKTNAETTYTVNYCKAAAATLTPADYQIAPADFTGATITLGGTFDKYVVGDDVAIIRLINNNTLQLTKAFTSNDITVSQDKKTLSVSFDGLSFANNDKYQISVVAGSFITTENGSVGLNTAISKSYFLFDGLAEAQILSKPDMISTPTVSPIMLTWDYQTIHAVSSPINVQVSYTDMKDNYNEVAITLDSSAVQLVNEQPTDGTSASSGNNVLKIDLTSAIANLQDKAYLNPIKVVIPQGVIANESDQVNQESEITFTIYPLTDCEVIFEEEDEDDPGVYYLGWTIMDNLSEITSNSYGPTEMYLYDSTGQKVATLPNYYSSYTTPAYWLYGYSMLNGFNTELYVDVDIMSLDEGSYTLEVPEAMFIIYTNDTDNTKYLNAKEELEVKVGTSGIEDLKSEVVNGVEVYNLNGVKVLDSQDCNALNGLSNGIYIINGKKVLIRK